MEYNGLDSGGYTKDVLAHERYDLEPAESQGVPHP